MRVSRIRFIQHLGVSLALAIVAGRWASHASASTFVYDLPHITPDVLPQNLPSTPWTLGGGNGPGSVSGDSDILTMTDGSGTYGPYYTHNLSVSDINSNMNYEIRARARVSSQTTPTTFVFNQDISDGARYMGWAVMLTNNVHRFWIATTSGTPLLGLTADVAGSDFFQIDLKRTGNNVQLSVDNVALINVLYTDLFTYSPRAIDFGDGSSGSQGIAQLTGVSFGINELAPELIPEPSTVMLAGSGALLLALRRRRQS